MRNEEIKAMLKECTNMTDRDIDRHIEDGVMVYESREEAIQAGIDALMDDDEAEEYADRMDKMNYNRKTFYVDFAL